MHKLLNQIETNNFKFLNKIIKYEYILFHKNQCYISSTYYLTDECKFLRWNNYFENLFRYSEWDGFDLQKSVYLIQIYQLDQKNIFTYCNLFSNSMIPLPTMSTVQ